MRRAWAHPSGASSSSRLQRGVVFVLDPHRLPNPSSIRLPLVKGSFIYLSYSPNTRSSQPPPPKALSSAGSFGKKMTVDDLIACHIRVTRKKMPLCAAPSFDRDAAHAFPTLRG
ncbi:hypothetical protein E2562_016892 [Oryza meyeriana var. granulata]|uniref:Uncharacterized protein n=1 Tax=Oryza meyeriana var. granulata TaxID=110450 RepID=A0A6G1DW57_9ORYZ|nr:hypothetical protein E2562_016892 [Oryza meyeriana var. granulata]